MIDISYKIENAILYICTTCLILGLFYMSNSFHSLWGLLLLVAITSPRTKKESVHHDI